ncbi:MAG: glutamate synthase, partial [Candidatus Wallbacteria bacterium]|nr:glutamate synthase [Candidatus Wallbacteria bacterium]
MSESSDRLRECAERLVAARGSLVEGVPAHVKPQEAEGGCGVLGLACSVPIAGRHLLRPMRQMCNRGNGKGGGIAAVGLSAAQLGVDEKTLAESYLVQVAYLDPSARAEAERDFLEPAYEIGQAAEAPSVGNYRAIAGLEVAPPTVWRYFARPRPAVLEEFAARHGLEDLAPDEIADEFVFQASYRINRAFYASLGDKRAFVLSHGKDTIVMKLVGYAEQAIEYYRLQDLQARVWIGHQRYPTKGRVWHPGGAHPFIGLHEALVHNGDFANYASICEYLAQRNLAPLFLTDTEVAVLLFDLWSRVYRYPLEYVIEAMAPTTERDFDLLPPEKKRTYRRLQLAHVHGSPDGPWFFIVARNDVRARCWQLLGITDTSMLRPQVFALHEGHVQIGLIASERQAIDALLEEVSAADDRVNPVADLYWNARGGSHTDGGA